MHRKSGGQSLSLPEQLGFFDIILRNRLYPPAEKCNVIVSSADGADILSEGSSGVQLCSGMRLYSPRVFDLPSIPLLCFHVHAFFQNGSCTSLEAIPTNIRIVESTMRLVAATFFSCGHYNAAFCGKDRQWYFYDGLRADVRISFASPWITLQ